MEEENKVLTKKHISERQRRARINTYLEEIQKLTDEGLGTASSARMEKAEVLERAVSYIQNTELGADPNNNSNSMTDVSEKEVYKHGFTSCMNTILNQVSASQTLGSETSYLKYYLNNFLQNRLNQTPEEEMTHRVTPDNDEFMNAYKEELGYFSDISLSDIKSEPITEKYDTNSTRVYCKSETYKDSQIYQSENRLDRTERVQTNISPENIYLNPQNNSINNVLQYQQPLSLIVYEHNTFEKQDMTSDTTCSTWIKQESDPTHLQVNGQCDDKHKSFESGITSIVWRPW